MGLAERQFLDDIRTKRVPYHEKNLEEAVGKRIAIEVAWETLESDPEAVKFFDSTALGEFVGAIREIARKPLGKATLAEKVATAHFVHTPDPSAKGIQLEGDTLRIVAKWGKEFAHRIGEAEMVRLITGLL